LMKNAAIGSHFSLQVPVRAISISKWKRILFPKESCCVYMLMQ